VGPVGDVRDGIFERLVLYDASQEGETLVKRGRIACFG